MEGMSESHGSAEGQSTVAPATAARSPAWRRWTLAGVLLLGVVLIYALGLHHYLSWEFFRTHLDELQTHVHEHLLLSAGLYFATYVVVTALSLPLATPLSLVGAALFGRWLGTALISMASTLGATLAFLSARYVLRDWVLSRWGNRLKAINDGVLRDGAYYLFALRLVPLFPFFLINLGMGLTPLRTRTYVWVSWLGMLPGTFLYVNAGAALADIQSPGDVLSPGVLVSLGLLGVVPLALRLIMRRRPASGAP
jgi:uncharacterized membrane protein YdjX (TVP38/TMEM64 family)